MPFFGGPDLSIPPPPAGADTALPFRKTLAVAGTAEDFATILSGKKGLSISLVNLGPGSAFIRPDATANLVATDSIEVKSKEGYSDAGLLVATKWSFVGETGKLPEIRGVVWAGTAT